LSFQNLVRGVPVADNVVQFAVRLADRTRPSSPDVPAFIKNWIRWGAGPRASQYLILGAKSRAILHGRFTPDIEDVKAIAGPVLASSSRDKFQRRSGRYFSNPDCRKIDSGCESITEGI